MHQMEKIEVLGRTKGGLDICLWKCPKCNNTQVDTFRPYCICDENENVVEFLCPICMKEVELDREDAEDFGFVCEKCFRKHQEEHE